MSERTDAALQRARLEGDAGITAVWVALMLVALMLVAAMAIDGGQTYASRRVSQNASDAGALAGARMLDDIRFNSATTYAAANLDDEILKFSQASGVSGTGDVTNCWLLDEDKNRLGSEFCASGAEADAGLVASAYGIEVNANNAEATNFARVVGYNQTTAPTKAKAFVYNFAGGTNSPFIVCGADPTKAGSESFSGHDEHSYDLMYDGPDGLELKDEVIGMHFAIQGAQIPECGASQFKGKAAQGADPIGELPSPYEFETGNGFNSDIVLAVAGIVPCAAGTTDFNGCGMLIPIASWCDDCNGSEPTMIIEAWTVWQVWGQGTGSYDWTSLGSAGDPTGSNCRVPITVAGGSVKYCGKLLGKGVVNGGNAGDPASDGQPHVFRLSE
jgi:hypothetical protein